jgi:hypothetical protein
MSRLKLNTSYELRTVEETLDCPVCGGMAPLKALGDAFYYECNQCGVQGFRYVDKSAAKQDFPRHHTIAKKRVR